MHEAGSTCHMNKGKIVQVVGPVVDVAFPGETARHQQRVDRGLQSRWRADPADARGAAAPRRQVGPDRVDVRHRRPQARLRGGGHGRADFHARRRRRDGARVRRVRQPGRRARAGQGGEILSHPPRGAETRGPIDVAAGAHHRHQSHRPDLPIPERRKGRGIRWRGRRQDRRHHGVDQQHRQAARRRLRVRRRRRAHPRGQRPIQGNVRSRRHQAGEPGRARRSRWCTGK